MAVIKPVQESLNVGDFRVATRTVSVHIVTAQKKYV